MSTNRTLKPPTSPPTNSLPRQQSFNSTASTSSTTTSSGDVLTYDYDADQSTVADTETVTGTPEPPDYTRMMDNFSEHSDTLTSSSSSPSCSSSSSSSSEDYEDNMAASWCYILPEMGPELSHILSNIKTVTFDFCLRVDRVRVSWKDQNAHRLDQYQLRAYLLLNELDEEEELDFAILEDNPANQDHPFPVTSISTTTTDKISKPAPKPPTSKHHIKTDQKQLIAKPMVAKRSLTLSTSGVTEICFDNQEIRFRARIPVTKSFTKDSHHHLHNKNKPDYVFESRVVRLKLERVKKAPQESDHHHHRVIIGFVDLDLAQLRHQHARDPGPRADGFMDIPMVLFTNYNRHILKHERSKMDSPLFCFDIRLRLDSAPLAQDGVDPLLLPLDLWVSAESLFCTSSSDSEQTHGTLSSSNMTSNNTLTSTSTSQSMHLSQLLYRCDSLPNMSKDKELKYHECPPTSRTKHLLNLLGILPPGQLFRVSIHFGQLEQLDHLVADLDTDNCHQVKCVPKKLVGTSLEQQARAAICACFEVKHHQHQPTIFHHHHQRHSICCRTKQLTSNQIAPSRDPAPSQFDQHFTFFERFYYSDSPVTCLSIMNGAGKKLYKFKCHLAEYVHCRSVNQYFSLQGKTGKYCRLQFSIVVKPIGGGAGEEGQ